MRVPQGASERFSSQTLWKSASLSLPIQASLKSSGFLAFLVRRRKRPFCSSAEAARPKIQIEFGRFGSRYRTPKETYSRPNFPVCLSRQDRLLVYQLFIFKMSRMLAFGLRALIANRRCASSPTMLS